MKRRRKSLKCYPKFFWKKKSCRLSAS